DDDPSDSEDSQDEEDDEEDCKCVEAAVDEIVDPWLVDAAVAMYEENRVSYLELSKCTSKDQEVLNSSLKEDRHMTIDHHGVVRLKDKEMKDDVNISTDMFLRLALMRRGLALEQANILDYLIHDRWVERIFDVRSAEQPEGYAQVSQQQVISADKKLFIKLAEFTRSGIQLQPSGLPCAGQPPPDKVQTQFHLVGVYLMDLTLCQRFDILAIDHSMNRFSPLAKICTIDLCGKTVYATAEEAAYPRELCVQVVRIAQEALNLYPEVTDLSSGPLNANLRGSIGMHKQPRGRKIARERAATLKQWTQWARELAADEKKLFAQLDAGVANVLKGKRLLLLERIANSIGWPDTRLFAEMRAGFMIVGMQEPSGIFGLEPRPASYSVDELCSASKFLRPALLGKVRSAEDSDVAEELWQITLDEATNKALSSSDNWQPLLTVLDLASAYKQFAIHPSCRKYSIVALKRYTWHEYLVQGKSIYFVDSERSTVVTALNAVRDQCSCPITGLPLEPL
ncbi:unnamed protein product, partial [Effrenium voratum]